MSLYNDRREAGEKLSNHLEDKVEVDKVVLPHMDAFEVAKAVSSRLNADLHVRLSDYIPSPKISKLDIGAVSEDGTIWVEDGLRDRLNIRPNYIENAATIKSNFLREEAEKLNSGPKAGLKGETVLIVSDGISDGFREAAVAGTLRKEGVEEVLIAAPFISRSMMTDLTIVSDDLIYIREISFLFSPQAGYKDIDIDRRGKSSQKI